MSIDTRHINYNSYEWQLIRGWAEAQKSNKIGMLIGSDSHDKSNELRGAIKFIDQLLSLERLAHQQTNQT